MKTFKNQWPQGDIMLIRVAKLPPNVNLVLPTDRENIVAHSETGHHHVIDAATTEMYRLPEEIYECFLVVKEPTPLVHRRDWATHESVMCEPGVYKIRRQREHTPEGMRRVED